MRMSRLLLLAVLGAQLRDVLARSPAASSSRPFSMSSSVTLMLVLLGDRGHEEARANLLLGVGVDAVVHASAAAPA